MDERIISRVSQLAELSLDEKEKMTFAHDVERMLSYVDRLKELNTDGVEPLCQVTLEEGQNVLREDEVTGVDAREAFLLGAPERRGDFFAVPKSFT